MLWYNYFKNYWSFNLYKIGIDINYDLDFVNILEKFMFMCIKYMYKNIYKSMLIIIWN